MRNFFTVYHEDFDSNLQFWIAVFLSNLSFVSVAIYLVVYAHLLFLNFGIAATLLKALFLKWTQLYQMINGIAKQTHPLFNSKAYCQFRREFVRTLLFFASVNRMYGAMFLAFILVFCPVNCFFSVWIVSGSLDLHAELLMGFFCVHLYALLFAVHLMYARCIELIRRPCRPLMHIMAQKDKQIGLRTRLRLKLQIADLLSRKRYGFTYGHFGLVTMTAFFKVIFEIGN